MFEKCYLFIELEEIEWMIKEEGKYLRSVVEKLGSWLRSGNVKRRERDRNVQVNIAEVDHFWDYRYAKDQKEKEEKEAKEEKDEK